MADEAFALSPINARPSLPTEADYDAIHEAFMETARGRWFLGEYAKRNRNADTRMVLDAVERIESSLASQRQAQAEADARAQAEIRAQAEARMHAEALALARAQVQRPVHVDIRPQVDLWPDLSKAFTRARIEIAQRLVHEDNAQAFEAIRAALETIKSVVWALRERGFDSRVCDFLDIQVKAITDGYTGLMAESSVAGEAGTEVLAAFDALIQHVEGLTKAGDAETDALDVMVDAVADAMGEDDHQAAASTQRFGARDVSLPVHDLAAEDSHGRGFQTRDSRAHDFQTNDSRTGDFHTQDSQSDDLPAQDFPARDLLSEAAPAHDLQNHDASTYEAPIDDVESATAPLPQPPALEVAPAEFTIDPDVAFREIYGDDSDIEIVDAAPLEELEEEVVLPAPPTEPEMNKRRLYEAKVETYRSLALARTQTVSPADDIEIVDTAGAEAVRVETESPPPVPPAPAAVDERSIHVAAMSPVPATEQPKEKPASLGDALIANGVIQNPAAVRPDPLAPFRRMSQAEKIALFT